MKKIYYFILLNVFVFSLKAQYTITSSGNPVIGDTESDWNLDTTNLSMGSAGIGQVWDYTNIVISPSTAISTSSYIAKSLAPNSSLYPSANISQTSDNLDYGMYSYNSSGITFYGFTNNNNLVAVYQNPETVLSYPFTYGTTSSDTYSCSYTYSSISYIINGTITVTGDGTGTLNTPGNSFTNVLRTKTQSTSILNLVSLGSYTNVQTGYSYFNSTSKFSLLSVSTTTSSSTTNTTTIKKAGVVNNNVLTGIKENYNETNFSIYPNPSSDKKIELYFVLVNEEKYTAIIYNALGQTVKQIELGTKPPGIYNEIVDLETLQSGVYYLHLKGNKQEGVRKIIIQ